MTGAELSDAEFDALHGGRELLPIEQLAYDHEGAERFSKAHGHSRGSPKQVENWVGKLNKLAREMDAPYEHMHPNAAFEQNRAQAEEWKRLAAQDTEQSK